MRRYLSMYGTCGRPVAGVDFGERVFGVVWRGSKGEGSGYTQLS